MRIKIFIYFLSLFFIFKISYAQNFSDISDSVKFYLTLVENDFKNQKTGKLKVYWNKALKFAKNYKEKYYCFLFAYYPFKISKQYDSIELYLKKATQIAEENNIKKDARYYDLWGHYYLFTDQFSEAIKSFKNEENYLLQIQDDDGLLNVYSVLGLVYKNLGDYKTALEYYLKSLHIAENQNDNEGQIVILNSIATLYQKQQKYDKAIEFLNQALDLAQKNDSLSHYVPLIKINIGYNLLLQKEYAKAYPLIDEVINYLKQSGQTGYLLPAMALMGDYFKNIKNYDKALEYYFAIMDSLKKHPSLSMQIRTLLDLSETYKALADSTNNYSFYHKSLQYALQGEDLASKIQALPYLKDFHEILMNDYEAIQDFQNAYIFAKKYIETSQKLMDEEKNKAIQEMETKYEVEKYQKEAEKQKLIIARQKLQKKAMTIGLILVLLIVFVVYRSYRQKKRDNEIIKLKNAELQQANEEIRVQRDLLREQKERIEDIHQKLTDSIRYAKRIQTAAMPSDEDMKKLFKDYFIYFKPLQTVSGDFYWAKKVKNIIVFTVADCTGHGVPGAFVSMLGISLLNEISQKEDVKSTAEVLEHLRKNIKISLNQSFEHTEQMDGMDMALCAFDPKTGILQYSGANRPIIVISSDGTLMEYKPVRNPVAFYFDEKPFETINIKLKPGDTIYLFSDGITDLFNPNRKKFTKKRLKELLLQVYDKNLEKQKKLIADALKEWQGDAYQIDDMTLMAVRLI